MSKTKYVRYKDIKNHFYKEVNEDIQDFDFIQYVPDYFDVSHASQLKDPYTPQEMITKLKNHKMNFANIAEEKECESILNTVNYYTLKYFANTEFGENEEKDYKYVIKLYFFNKYLCTWLHELISHLEIHLRTITVDVLTNNYTGTLPKSLFYLDRLIYKKENKKQSDINKLLESFNNIISENKSRSKSINHNLNTYKAVPAWAVFDLSTIGTLSFFFQNIERAERKKVTNFLSKLSQEYCPGVSNKIPDDALPSWINAIRHLRNVVSHTGKIYGENFDIPPKQHKEDKEFFEQLKPYTSYDKRLSIYLIMMKRLYMTMPQIYHEKWNEHIINLHNKFESDNLYNLARIGLLKEQFVKLYI